MYAFSVFSGILIRNYLLLLDKDKPYRSTRKSQKAITRYRFVLFSLRSLFFYIDYLPEKATP
jgi:hypothetical protein